YFDASTQSIRFEEMCGAVDRMSRDDVIVLHGCCHNPTGTDLSLEQWRHLGRLLTERGVVPWIDLAYAGLGDGLDKDLAGTRAIVSMASVTMIAVSCSKNFGVYRDRVGCSIVSTDSSETAESLRGHLGAVARTLYSMPPDHGAAVIRTILADGVLRSLWNEELTVMQHRVSGLRSQLANRLNQLSGTDRWDFIAGQKGMFSLLGTSDEAVAELKQKHGIYIVKGGRLNIAGLREADIDRVARALIDIEH
ncbi:MAG: aminotransferase class I/II-fold pyridoxal phosphate-dependent enzyme, partial [Sulfitobacter sp.]|nr:aminotransferase class I/II-fold pyridoxal phosphate-dependent enzyme [Sulfitobacter sp.]